MDVRRVIVALGRAMVAYDLGVIRLQNEVEGIPEFRISFFFFFKIHISIPVGIRMDRPAGYLLHKYLRDPYYLNPVKTRRRNKKSV